MSNFTGVIRYLNEDGKEKVFCIPIRCSSSRIAKRVLMSVFETRYPQSTIKYLSIENSEGKRLSVYP